MFLGQRLTLATLGGLLVIAYACNIQPADRPAPPAPGGDLKAKLLPEKKQPTEAKRKAEPTRSDEAREANQVALPTGPLATDPAPLPKADKVIALFHSGNMEGELDPCG